MINLNFTLSNTSVNNSENNLGSLIDNKSSNGIASFVNLFNSNKPHAQEQTFNNEGKNSEDLNNNTQDEEGSYKVAVNPERQHFNKQINDINNNDFKPDDTNSNFSSKEDKPKQLKADLAVSNKTADEGLFKTPDNQSVMNESQQHTTVGAMTAKIKQGTDTNNIENDSNDPTKPLINEKSSSEQQQTNTSNNLTSSPKQVTEFQKSNITSTVKELGSTIQKEITKFESSTVESQSVTIRIKPASLGEIVITMKTDATNYTNQQAGVDVKLYFTNADIKSYLNLIKRDITAVSKISSISLQNSQSMVRSVVKTNATYNEKENF